MIVSRMFIQNSQPMKSFIAFAGALAFVVILSAMNRAPESEGWITLFDGKTLNGWKVGEHPGTFTVADGAIVVFGERAHLFYEGPIKNHEFKNFEFKAQVMTTPGSNSGIFIHTTYQETGWPIQRV